MARLTIAVAVSVLFAVACTPNADDPATPAADTTAASEPAPMPAEAATPAPDARVAAMNLMCGGESFRVAFLDTQATLVNADGSNTDLPLLAPDANAAPGVSTYTNGTMTFARSGGGDTPTVIRFARGRMAFQDCAIAQN
jgi:hypothetical protein